VKYLYLLLDLGTVFFPLLLSFDKKVAFYRSWRYVFVSSLVVGIPFLIWDMLFTKNGVWGFNPDYLTGINIGNLPLEEVLFFLLVPFACLFIYACVSAYCSGMKLQLLNRIVYGMLAVYIVFIAVTGYHGAYSQSVVVSSVVTLLILYFSRRKLPFLPLSFMISLLPFLLVNGVLTGGFTDEPVVWYNAAERTPFRIFTIPAEDVLYSFTLMGLNVWIFEGLKRSRRYPPVGGHSADSRGGVQVYFTPPVSGHGAKYRKGQGKSCAI